MTTELEQEFFEAFGIEQKTNGCEEYFYMPDAESCKECEDKPCLKHLEYPQITDRKLLEMICIINEFISMFNWKQIKYISTFEFETLKENILKDLIWILNNKCNDITAKQLKHQIQQLFKEEE